jgi:eukaryotic-like serine/threonine-protein kinase
MPEARTCSSCGAELPADSLSALCPRCSPHSGVATDTPADEAGLAGTIILPLPLSEKPGDKISHYKLLQEIGAGGFGVVYMAEQEEPVRRRVALKIIKLGMDTKEVIARFEAERQALALMDHPHIAKVLDAGATAGGRPYFVMELVKGERITEYCDKNNLTTRQRLDLFVQICQAIQHAHQKGIIHRDIKPSNILVAMQDGVPVPKVIDFGIAKATEQRLTDKTFFTALGDFVGTPVYMSPEQAEMTSLDIDTRSDIYSLGVLLYELLTGKTPFDPRKLLAKGIEEMRRTIREDEPRWPSTRLTAMDKGELTSTAKRRQTDAPKLVHSVRGDLDWIVMKCLEKDRTRRYETANELALDLQRHIHDEPVLARSPSKAYRFQKMVRRNKAAFAATALTAVVLVAATGISVWQAVRATRAQTLANQRLAESEAISKFLTEVFQSPDPARDGRTITVAETLGAAAKKLDSELTNQPARRAKLQAALGATYAALGLYHEAIPLLEKVRDYDQAVLGPENLDTLAAMGNVAISYAESGRRGEALKLREQVLALYRKVSGPENPETIDSMHNLANSYFYAGQGDKALKLREEVLALRRKVLGPEHLDTIKAMNNLANSYSQAGRRDEALKLREEVSALRRKLLGPEHPETLLATAALAHSYDDLGRREEALKLREEVLRLYRKVLGPEHPNTLLAMQNLAASYNEVGRKEEALKLKQEVLPLYTKVLGPEHPETLMAMNNLAVSYNATGHREEALKLREQVLQLYIKVLGPEHRDTLRAMNNLAVSYNAAGRLAEALKMREQVLPLYTKALGPEHPDTLVAMNNLAVSYYAAGRLAEALKLREQVLPLCLKVLGPEDPDTFRAMNNLATSWDTAGRHDEALKLREQALAVCRKVNAADHHDTLTAMQNLAACYAEAGRQQEAIALLQKCCELDPKDADASLTLATWQTWFAKTADYAATRRRLVQEAEGTDQAATAEGAAKAACLLPSADAALLTNALHLAQQAVELGRSSSSLPLYQLTLGLAEYRNGQYPAAEKSITTAEQTLGGHDDIQGIARMFHAMTLFRQDRPEEARKLFSQAEAHMPPLPKDENKPIVDGRTFDHDVLTWWLAYKEAKSLLGEPAAVKQ